MRMGLKHSNNINIKLYNGILMTKNVLHVMSYLEFYQPAHNVLQSMEISADSRSAKHTVRMLIYL